MLKYFPPYSAAILAPVRFVLDTAMGYLWQHKVKQKRIDFPASAQGSSHRIVKQFMLYTRYNEIFDTAIEFNSADIIFQDKYLFRLSSRL